MAEGGVDEGPPTYVLVETDSLDGAFSPIRSSVRVKYTCFDVSNHYMVFGSTSGGIFLFHRESVSYIKTLPNKEGPVNQVALAPDDSILAFATNRGHVVVIEHNAEKEGSQPTRLQISYEHKGTLVTYLQWGSTTTRLYAGDVAGRVSVVNVAQSRTRSLFQVPSATLIKLESRIVQLDFAKDHLLISTHTRCVVYDTNKELWVQIGKKSREGDFGACFLPGPRYQDPCTIYAARPGSRLWEADLQGNVICTHQLKEALSIPSSNIVSYRYDYSASSSETAPQSVSFSHLFTLWPKCENMPFLLTWSHFGFYVFHPKQASIVLWNDEIKGIKSIRCYKNNLYLHHAKDCYTKLSLLTVDQAANYLCQKKLHLQGAQLLVNCPSTSRKGLSLAVLNDLIDRVSEMGHVHLASQLMPLVSSLKLVVATISATKSPQRARSAMSNWKHQNNQKAARCRSASPLLQSSRSQPSRRASPRVSRSSTPQKDRSSESETTSHSDSDSDQRRYFKPLPLENNRKLKETRESQPKPVKPAVKELPNLHSVKLGFVNGALSPVCEAKVEYSPDNPNYSISENINRLAENPKNTNRSHSENSDQNKKHSPLTLSEQASMTDRLKNLENGMRSQKDKRCDGTALLGDRPKEENLEFNNPYRLLGLNMYGGSLMLPPGFDIAVLNEAETSDLGGLDLSRLCDSISTTLTTGKKVILQNLRGLETKIKQFGTDPPQELLDVRTKPDILDGHGHGFENKIITEPYGSETEWDYLPEVDVTSLLTITSSTKKHLDNPAVLLDSTQCHSVLEAWVNELHKVQMTALTAAKSAGVKSHLAETEEDSKYLLIKEPKASLTFWTLNLGLEKLSLSETDVVVYEPYSISPEAKKDMSELATICLQAGVIGKIEALEEYFQSLVPVRSFENLANNHPEDGKILPSDNCFPSYCEAVSPVKSSTLVSNPQAEEKRFVNCVLSTSDEEDRKCALFLQNYYYLLKPEEARKIISDKRRYRSWCVLMRGLATVYRRDHFSAKLSQNNILEVCQWFANSDHSLPSVLAHLIQLASVNHQRAAEFCWKKCHYFSSQDMLYLSRTMSCHPELFLTSLGMVLNSQKQTALLDKTFNRLFSLEEVRWEWVWHILSQRLTQSVTCVCGAPRPGSHLYPWDYGEEILHILKVFPVEKKYLALCQSKGFWNGYLHLLKSSNQHEKHLQVILQLGDAVLLSSSHPLGCLPENRDDWKSFLLKILDQQKLNSSNTTCLSCSQSTPSTFPSPSTEDEPWKITLTLDRAVLKLSGVCKPREVLQILGELPLPPGAISPHVFQALILTHVIDRQQSSMSLSMLARLESYMWSRRSTAIPSQIYRVFEKEKKDPKGSNLLPSSEECRLQAYYLEEPENHWGTSTQLNQPCLLCGILLTSCTSAELGGVTVCSCGHSYHSACLPERLCILCLEQPCRSWE